MLLSGVVLKAQQPLPAPYSSGVQTNSVRTWMARKPLQNESDVISSSRTAQEVIQATEYQDGFGRPLETVTKQVSPLGNDLVSAAAYDPYGREQFVYLPFVSNVATGGDMANDGNFKLDPFQQQAAFYNTYLNGQPGETSSGSGANWAYSQKIFENSPLNRVNTSYLPGVNLVGSQSSGRPHGMGQQYFVNVGTDNVQMWNIGGAQGSIPTSGGAYLAGTLYKTVETDEQGHQAIEFKDMYGQMVLKKVQEGAVSDNGSGSAHSGWECTYYVYDDYGNLRFVIPPAVVQQIDGTWSIGQTTADELCYRIEYDIQGRPIIKKWPGTPSGSQGEVWTVYDSRNRPVMTQDGNLRGSSQWLCTLYDVLDRQVTTGMITYSGNVTSLQTVVNQQTTVTVPAPQGLPATLDFTSTTSGDYEATVSITLDPGFATVDQGTFSATTFGTSVTGGGSSTVGNVTVNLDPLPQGAALTTLTATFYDNYNWLSNYTTPFSSQRSTSGDGQLLPASNTSAPYAQPVTQSNMVLGQVTGMYVAVQGTSQNLYTVNYYDEYGRKIQVQSTNYSGGTDIATRQFDFTNHLLVDYVQHQKAGTNGQTHAVLTKRNYDGSGRLLTITKTVNSTVGTNNYSTPAQTIVSNTYDEMGKLKQKTLGTSMETLTYDYNVRGSLLGVNRAFAKSTSSTSNYFGFDLGYDNGAIADAGGSSIGSYANPAYNGYISGIVWKSKGDNQMRKYDFTYDAADRLTAADFNQQSGGFNKTAGLDFSVNTINYDVNGNIHQLSQNGWIPGGSQNIDNLTYNYMNGGSSYRLLNVADNSGYNGSNPQSTLGDFHYSGTKTGSSVDYGYDPNGNAVSDANRQVTAITYSYLNKPTLFTIPGKGTIQYVYDAAGTKLQKITTDNSVQGKTVTTTTTYIGGFVYRSRTTVPADPNNPDFTDVLQFITHEEGRVRFLPPANGVAGSYVFDYFIRDHLNNVRMVLTDEQQRDIYPAATLETAAVATEQSYYNINSGDVVAVSGLTWYNSVSGSGYNNSNGSVSNPGNPNPTGTSAEVYKLNGQTGDRYGLGITIKVMAGDQVSIFGKSFWHNTGGTTGSAPITSVIGGLVNVFGGSPAVAGSIHGGTLSGLTSPTGPLFSMLTNTPSQPAPNTEPKAAINWILFDDQFNPVSVGTDLVSSTPDVVKPHSEMNIPMAKNGYLYVYCSNESDLDVYFDNLQVINTRGPILEEAHYYPTGLMMAGISDRAWNKMANSYHYQSNEMQNQEFADMTGLEEYDFDARMYDQQLGVWHNQDPASQHSSPYKAMAHNWPNGVDPNGKGFFGLDDIVVLAVGFVTGFLEYGFTDHFVHIGKALETGLADAAEAEVGYLTLGGGLSAAGAQPGALAKLAIPYSQSFLFGDLATVGQNLKNINDASLSGRVGMLAGFGATAAISAGFASNGTQDWIDKALYHHTLDGIFKGVASQFLGGALSSAGNELITNHGMIDRNTLFAAGAGGLSSAAGQIAHNSVDKLWPESKPDNLLKATHSYEKNLLTNIASGWTQQFIGNLESQIGHSWGVSDSNYGLQYTVGTAWWTAYVNGLGGWSSDVYQDAHPSID